MLIDSAAMRLMYNCGRNREMEQRAEARSCPPCDARRCGESSRARMPHLGYRMTRTTSAHGLTSTRRPFELLYACRATAKQ